MKANELRKTFLEFFVEKDHTVWPSDSLAPENDATLLFTGAGMNQFKDMFIGKGNLGFKRAVTCQKCLRTPDIEVVGRTASHHTFFEMLGNFSFGDYFKAESIAWAWEFMLNVLGFPEERLYITVYDDDEDAYNIWKNDIGVAPEKIYKYDASENFWPKNAPAEGPNGLCGPCSEIFYHQGEEFGCGRLECDPSCECDRYVEVWNLVFQLFNRKAGGLLEQLDTKNIDTGMGFERTLAMVQGVHTNFETDLFVPIIERASDILGAKYEFRKRSETNRRLNRIADHSRAIVFCIADGVVPTNEGRGYVLRRLTRRAAADGIKLGHAETFLHELVPIIADIMEEAYPYLKEGQDHIVRAIKAEEEKFLRTLQQGTRMLEQLMDEIRERGEGELSGEEAFRLYDTYGFPLEIAEAMLADEGLSVDKEGFEKEMELQRERARSSAAFATDIFDTGPLREVKRLSPMTEFLGYVTTESETKIVAIIKDDKLVDSVKTGDEATIVLDKTPFYGEAGGQLGDTGLLKSDGKSAEINDVQKSNVYTLHVCKVTKGELHAGDALRAKVDGERRDAIRRSHSATHLLHHALRETLGMGAQQAGSLVAPDRFRFDFAHSRALTKDELRRIEGRVNEMVIQNDAVTTNEMSLEDAKKTGAIAFFGEKYGEQVRVVKMGDYSAELCGGTHVSSTGDIGLFRIISEGSIAAGTRRIEATTASAALDAARKDREIVDALCSLLSCQQGDLENRITQLTEELKDLKKEIQKLKRSPKELPDSVSNLLSKAKNVGGVQIISEKLQEAGADQLRDNVDAIKRTAKSAAIVLGAVNDSKVQLVAAFTPDVVVRGLHAGDLIKEIAKIVQGGGGGRADMAQAGGRRVDMLDQALARAKNLMTEKLS